MPRFATIRTLLVLLTLTCTLVVGTAMPALAQEAPTGTVRIRPEATLVAKGAAVRLPVRYSCSPDTLSGSLDVRITQRVGGNRLAQGSGSTQNLICDGSVHTVVVTVTAQGENAFRRGTAFAEAFLFLCNDVFTCSITQTSRTITIVSG